MTPEKIAEARALCEIVQTPAIKLEELMARYAPEGAILQGEVIVGDINNIIAAARTLLPDALDEIERLRGELFVDGVHRSHIEATLRREVLHAHRLLERAATYTGLEGWACPMCRYENGKFIARCEPHRQLDEAKAENERLRSALHGASGALAASEAENAALRSAAPASGERA